MIAVLTAGGRVKDALAREIGTPVKALAPWRGATLLTTAIESARAVGAERVYVVGDPEVHAACAGIADAVIPAARSGAANLETALRMGVPNRPLLLLTSDLPFVNAASLRAFLDRCGEAEVAMPLAEASAYESAYPGAADHVTTLGGERIANGSVFYFASAEAAERTVRIARELFDARKSLPRMAMLLDLPLLARFLFRRLRIEDLEAYAQRKFGLRMRAVRGAAPELCYDVDTVDDYRYALRLDATMKHAVVGVP